MVGQPNCGEKAAGFALEPAVVPVCSGRATIAGSHEPTRKPDIHWMNRAPLLTGFLGCLWVLAVAACDRSAPAKLSAEARPTPTAASPAEAVAGLQAAYQKRDYESIMNLVVPSRRVATVDFLSAVDEVLAANSRLRKTAESMYQGPVSETWSIGEIENNLGPFSARVKLIGQEMRGDGAVVTLQEGSHIPLFKANFVHDGNGWLYDAEPIPAAMIGELRRLATTLDEVAQKVRDGADIRYYMDIFFTKVAPQMCRVLTATDPVVQTAQTPDDNQP